MVTISFVYLYRWQGDAPNCLTIKDGQASHQNLFNSELMDPVKGHLYDLDHDRCLVHQQCTCKLHVTCLALLNSRLFASTSGSVPTVRKAVQFFQAQLNNIVESANNPDVYWILHEDLQWR